MNLLPSSFLPLPKYHQEEMYSATQNATGLGHEMRTLPLLICMVGDRTVLCLSLEEVLYKREITLLI